MSILVILLLLLLLGLTRLVAVAFLYLLLASATVISLGNYIFDSLNDPGYISTCRCGISRIDKPLGGSLAR